MRSERKKMAQMCSKKRSFFSTQEASRSAARIRKAGGPLMRWYQCHLCGKWHFTSKTEEEYVKKAESYGT